MVFYKKKTYFRVKIQLYKGQINSILLLGRMPGITITKIEKDSLGNPPSLCLCGPLQPKRRTGCTGSARLTWLQQRHLLGCHCECRIALWVFLAYLRARPRPLEALPSSAYWSFLTSVAKRSLGSEV